MDEFDPVFKKMPVHQFIDFSQERITNPTVHSNLRFLIRIQCLALRFHVSHCDGDYAYIRQSSVASDQRCRRISSNNFACRCHNSLRSWRYCVLVATNSESISNASSPLPFLDRGPAAKTLITQYRQLRRLVSQWYVYPLPPPSHLSKQVSVLFLLFFVNFANRHQGNNKWFKIMSHLSTKGKPSETK